MRVWRGGQGLNLRKSDSSANKQDRAQTPKPLHCLPSASPKALETVFSRKEFLSAKRQAPTYILED